MTEEFLKSFIEKRIPSFVKCCDLTVDEIIFHQDAFATDYGEKELLLLGMAVKYAGLRGKSITVCCDTQTELKIGTANAR